MIGLQDNILGVPGRFAAGRALRHSAFAPASSFAPLIAVAAFGVAPIPNANKSLNSMRNILTADKN